MLIRLPSQKSAGGSGPICRICLSDEGEDSEINPLFSPCKCAGTMKYIHLNCLQEWLNSRMVMKETASTKTYFWKNLECELCKTAFPNFVRLPG
jgi:E3 ubiquitin-protein ligase DOA10